MHGDSTHPALMKNSESPQLLPFDKLGQTGGGQSTKGIGADAVSQQPGKLGKGFSEIFWRHKRSTTPALDGWLKSKMKLWFLKGKRKS